jgi:alkylation response protein AidB-like acyl-CoA dehydrogenase
MIVPDIHTEVQREIAAVARDFFAKNAGPRRLRDAGSANPFDPAVWAQMAELGWLDILVDGEFGPDDAGVITEAAGAELYAGPLTATIAAAPLLRDKVDAPGAVMTIAWEGAPDSVEADLAPLPTLTDGRLEGAAALVPFADSADFLVVRADAGEEAALVVVENAPESVETTAHPSADPAGRSCDVRFHGAAAAAAVGPGPDVAFETLRLLARCRALTAAETVGVATRVLEIATQYALDRHQFDRPVGSFQAVQQRLADMAAATVTARAASDVGLEEAGGEHGGIDRTRVAKAYTARAVREVTEGGLQTLGGIAFTEEHDLHLYLKRGLALAAAWGETDLQELELGRSLLERTAA